MHDYLKPILSNDFRHAPLATNRDAWVYSFSNSVVTSNVLRMIDVYNAEVRRFSDYCHQNGIHNRKDHVDSFINPDATKINWSARLRSELVSGRLLTFDPQSVVQAVYRPFTKQAVYFNKSLNERTGQLASMFPTAKHRNHGFYLPNPGSSAPPFLCLMTDDLPDLGAAGISGVQFFPRWTYQKPDSDGGFDFCDDSEIDQWGYRLVDNITDDILALYRKTAGDQITKDDIFHYVYGVLHDPDYRTRFAADLKKMLPHIPTPDSAERFQHVSDIGRQLGDLHVNYEAAEPFPLDV